MALTWKAIGTAPENPHVLYLLMLEKCFILGVTIGNN